MNGPTEDEFKLARHLEQSDLVSSELQAELYQVMRWYRGGLFRREDAERGLTHLRNRKPQQ